jgi:glycosyltransferase involved in cell wall biosynthesis
MLRVLFLIRDLQRGGAERQLVTLVRNLDHSRFCVTVLTYYTGGELVRDLQGLPNVQVISAGKTGRWDTLGFLVRLYLLARRIRPHIVHGYMYGANELALLLGRALRARVVWGVRASGLDMRHYDGATRLLNRTGAWLSSRADALIANSTAGRRDHLALGYPPERFVVVPNGIDTEHYRYTDGGRRRLRALWQVSDGDRLVGIVARIDPMKDHGTFLRAAAILAGLRRDVRFVIVGGGSAASLLRIRELATQLAVADRIVWAGSHEDMPAVYSALDLVTSSSAFGEGFSNSLAEAMACEKVCVATDVGDARMVLGAAGEIVPAAEPAALAAAWCRVLDSGAGALAARGDAARARVVETFSATLLAARTAELLARVAEGGELAAAGSAP